MQQQNEQYEIDFKHRTVMVNEDKEFSIAKEPTTLVNQPDLLMQLVVKQSDLLMQGQNKMNFKNLKSKDLVDIVALYSVEDDLTKVIVCESCNNIRSIVRDEFEYDFHGKLYSNFCTICKLRFPICCLNKNMMDSKFYNEHPEYEEDTCVHCIKIIDKNKISRPRLQEPEVLKTNKKHK